jgi:hypothetical protein
MTKNDKKEEKDAAFLPNIPQKQQKIVKKGMKIQKSIRFSQKMQKRKFFDIDKCIKI